MPCANSSTSPADAPACASAAPTAAMTPSDWSAGVVGDFAVTSRPPVASTASVNVPPTSTPSSTPSNLTRGRRAQGRAVREAPAVAKRHVHVIVRAGGFGMDRRAPIAETALHAHEHPPPCRARHRPRGGASVAGLRGPDRLRCAHRCAAGLRARRHRRHRRACGVQRGRGDRPCGRGRQRAHRHQPHRHQRHAARPHGAGRARPPQPRYREPRAAAAHRREAHVQVRAGLRPARPGADRRRPLPQQSAEPVGGDPHGCERLPDADGDPAQRPHVPRARHGAQPVRSELRDPRARRRSAAFSAAGS